MSVKAIDYQKLEIIGSCVISINTIASVAFKYSLVSQRSSFSHDVYLYSVVELLRYSESIDAYLTIISVAGRDDCYFAIDKVITMDKYHVKIYIIK